MTKFYPVLGEEICLGTSEKDLVLKKWLLKSLPLTVGLRPGNAATLGDQEGQASGNALQKAPRVGRVHLLMEPWSCSVSPL